MAVRPSRRQSGARRCAAGQCGALRRAVRAVRGGGVAGPVGAGGRFVGCWGRGGGLEEGLERGVEVLDGREEGTA